MNHFKISLTIPFDKDMKIKHQVIIGIFSMIFSIAGILLLQYLQPECNAFLGVGWFVFTILGFNSSDIYSNPDCIPSYYLGVHYTILFIIGASIVIYQIIKRQNLKKE